MNRKQFRTKFGGFLVALFAVLGISAVSMGTVQAQWRRDGQDRQREERNRDERNRDFRRGRDWNDNERNRNQGYRRDDRYRRNRDYDRNGRYGGYGNYGQYGDYGNYGRNGGYGYGGSQVAVSQGYQAGLSTGASDAQRGQSYNPQRSHYYRNPPDRGYSQEAFREGFVRGYAEGYQRYGGYNRGGRNYGQWFPW